MFKIDEDDVSLAAEAREQAINRSNFHKKFMEAMLAGDLIEEVDLTNLFDDLGLDAAEPQPAHVESNLGERQFSNQESVMTNTEIQDDVDAGLQEWSAEYDSLINNPPKDGDILTASALDANVLLMVELKEDNPPFIYGRAYVPEIVGQPLGWYLLDSNSQSFHGWKCILLPRARTELIRKFGLQKESMEVRSLRVVRPSQSGKSLLCEVHEYCKVETVKEEVKEEAVAQEPVVAQEVVAQEVVAQEEVAVDTPRPDLAYQQDLSPQ